jgi:O-antigen/teichoic acid export membrane protein
MTSATQSVEQTSAAPLVDSSKVLRALSWNTISTVSVLLIQIVRSAILARLLSPADYGLFGMAVIVTSAVSAFTSINATASLVVHPGAHTQNRRLLDSLWTFDVLRQWGTTLLLLLLAYPSAIYFRNRAVFPVLLISAFMPGILGLTSIGLMLLRKGIDFRTVAIHRVGSESALTLISLIIAIITRSVWALVWGQLLGTAVSVLFSYALHPYRPRFRYDREVLAESFRFSRSLFIITILTFITTQFDNLVVGRMLGTAVLGAYLLAYRLASMPVDVLADVVGSVMFPAFAGMTHPDARPRVEKALIGSFAITALVLAVCLIPMRIAGSDLIGFLYGNKWDAAIPMLRILIFVGFFRGVTRALSPFLIGFSRPGLDAIAKAIEAALFISLILVLVPKYGVTGAAWAGIATYALAALIRIAYVIHLLPGFGSRFLRNIGLVVLTIVASYFCAELLRSNGLPSVAAAACFVVFVTGSILAVQSQIRATALNMFRGYYAAN